MSAPHSVVQCDASHPSALTASPLDMFAQVVYDTLDHGVSIPNDSGNGNGMYGGNQNAFEHHDLPESPVESTRTRCETQKSAHAHVGDTGLEYFASPSTRLRRELGIEFDPISLGLLSFEQAKELFDM